MDRVLLFNIVQTAATLFALKRGGAPERIVGLALLSAAAATHLLLSSIDRRFAGVELGALTVDVLLLVVLVVVTLHADRHWVTVAAALQALGTGAHFAEAVSPTTTRLAYAILSAAWSYPIILVLIAGTIRHSRRLARMGRDLDWSRQDATLTR